MLAVSNIAVINHKLENWWIGRIGRQVGKWSHHLTAWSENLKQATCFFVPLLLLPVLVGFLHIFDQTETFLLGPLFSFQIGSYSLLQSFPMVLEWGTSWALGISPSNPRSTERTSITTRTTTRWPFLSSYLVINLFSEQSLLACSQQPNGIVF